MNLNRLQIIYIHMTKLITYVVRIFTKGVVEKFVFIPTLIVHMYVAKKLIISQKRFNDAANILRAYSFHKIIYKSQSLDS